MSALCDDSMCGWTHSHCRRCKNEIDGKNTVTFNGSLYCTDCATKEQKRQEDMTMRFESSITAMGTPDNRWFKVSVEKSFRSEDEADTVGCCSLKFEHVTLKPPNTVIFDFLGKDSIRFYDEVEVDPQVFKNLKLFKREPKSDGDEIFDRLTVSDLDTSEEWHC